MNLSKKIILLLLLAGAIIIIFYPQEKDIDIEGYWTSEKIIVNDTAISFTSDIHIYGNQIAINEHNLFDNGSYTFKRIGKDSINICCKEEKALIKDSLDLYEKEKNLEGNYIIKMSSKIIGGGTKAYYDIRFNLISKNRSINMYRTEPVNWNKRKPNSRF